MSTIRTNLRRVAIAATVIGTGIAASGSAVLASVHVGF